MFQAMAREFAANEILPHVEQMDREGAFNHDLLERIFAQGFMGIEVAESLRRQWRLFFPGDSCHRGILAC